MSKVRSGTGPSGPSVKNPMFLSSDFAESRKYGSSSRDNMTPRETPRTVRVDNDSDEPYYTTNHTHWASTSAMAPISHGENALLNDIERKEDEDENTIMKSTRIRTGTVAQDLQVRPNRNGTIDNAVNTGEVFNESKSKTRLAFDIFDMLVPRLQERLNFYTTAFFFLSLLCMGRYFTHPKAWFAIFFALIGIDLCTAVIDQCIFAYFIDKVFINHFEIAYLLHGFNGPMGNLIAIFIIGGTLNNWTAVKSVPNWDTLISALTIILLCICVKNWYSRKYYIRLLERRFSDKLFKLQSWTILLSELSTHRFADDVSPPASNKKAHDDGVDEESSLRSSMLGIAIGTTNTNSVHVTHSAYIPGFERLQKRVIDVFADLVDATAKYNDEFVEDVDLISALRKPSSPGGTAAANNNNPLDMSAGGRVRSNTTTKATAATSTDPTALRSEIRKKRTFWELAAKMSMNMGAMSLYTYNGRVTIRRKFQAKAFGKSLFVHLSRGGQEVISHDRLRQIFKERCMADDSTKCVELDDNEDDDVEVNNQKEMAKNRRRMTMAEYIGKENYSALQTLSSNTKTQDKDYETFLYEAAVELFDPFRLGYVTEEQCMAALCLVYKDQRFAATSLNDYGELHQSLRSVIDALFWTMMVIFLQSFLQLNILSYILPFATLLLTFSFAFGSLAGNLFLAITFVFFMSPYEVGNKIYIGADPNTRIVGFVRGVSLLYTTINTFQNEVMKIPNHTLFSEKICNLQESGGVVYTLNLSFNLGDGTTAIQAKIDQFFDTVKNYVLLDSKADWQACMIYCTSLDSRTDSINYSIWVTHRDNWQDSSKPYAARTSLVRYLKMTLLQYGLHYVTITQPVMATLIHDNGSGGLDDGNKVYNDHINQVGSSEML